MPVTLDSRDGGGFSSGNEGRGGKGGVGSFSCCGCFGPLDLDLDPITEPDKLRSKGIRLRALSRIFILSNMTQRVLEPYTAAPWQMILLWRRERNSQSRNLSQDESGTRPGRAEKAVL